MLVYVCHICNASIDPTRSKIGGHIIKNHLTQSDTENQETSNDPTNE